ncbi:MAG: carbamoyltransferase [Alphaproteobacteria bacterium]|nr:carbamoyltransferase [Alphaproteobacteria bacterium]
MLILGLNPGHDAAVALIDDGRPVVALLRERLTRRKRAALLTADFIHEALSAAGVAWSDIDAVAISTTQAFPIIFLDDRRFAFRLDLEQAAYFGLDKADHAARKVAMDAWTALWHETGERRFTMLTQGAWKEYITDDLSGLDAKRNVIRNLEWPIRPAFWSKRVGPDTVAVQANKIDPHARNLGGYIPATVTLDGVEKPALTVPHHLSHAANSYYLSGADRAAVYTVDNGDGITPGRGYMGGIFALGIGNRLMPMSPSYALFGHLYQRAAESLGLGHGGGAGKLMGLAPYGEPRFANAGQLGNGFELYGERFALGDKGGHLSVLDKLRAGIAAARDDGYTDPESPTPWYEEGAHGAKNLLRYSVDVAASAQWLFEENILRDTRTLINALAPTPHAVDVLCLGGGGALNCPANSRIAAGGLVDRVFIPPSCDDSGLALGAALAVCHDVLDRPRAAIDPTDPRQAYLGRGWDDSALDRAVELAGDAVSTTCPGDAPAAAGRDLADGRLVAWFEGRSEIGPRALGHRSLLADPRPSTQWRRVNDLKKREYWRPFAPAVLEEDAADWFEGAPSSSPFMLFTAQVKSDALPAVTHVDGSARIQTVDARCGGFRGVLESFRAATGVPVILNTSFNGPGEPIVDTPQEALAFLTSTELDVLYLDGRRITRRGTAE